VALSLGGGSGAVLAAQVLLPPSGSYGVYGNTSHTLHLNSRGGIVFDAYPFTMDIIEVRAWMYVNFGVATCSRNRIWSNTTLVRNKIEYNSPWYPITADGLWHQDYFAYTFPSQNVSYPSHGFWQTHDGGSSCGYGGGFYWEKPGQSVAWDSESTSP